MIPLLHDFTGEVVLVFGGGPVGARKARRFGEEARVVVLSPAFADREFQPGERRDPGAGVELVRAAPGPEDVAAWFERAAPALAMAATDDGAVNAAVAREARERGVLVNRADCSGDRGAGSVVVPATVREDPVVVALATGGSAPALSRYLRERFGEGLENAGEMASVVAEVREDLKRRNVPPEERRAAVRAVVRADGVWKDLGSDTDKARRTADGIVAAELSDPT
ncbi:MAG: bifunctional precorrin-2 dehydrogenase/sirohydrochlorin ferrochelatase [Haloarculaceae archaeon]